MIPGDIVHFVFHNKCRPAEVIEIEMAGDQPTGLIALKSTDPQDFFIRGGVPEYEGHPASDAEGGLFCPYRTDVVYQTDTWHRFTATG